MMASPMMASPRIKSPAADDLTNKMHLYFKNFFYKMTQVVVQARQGNRVRATPGGVSDLKKWFSLAIQDIPDLNVESKRIMDACMTSGQGLLTYPLCVEISLKTAEGDTMVLETWVLSLKENFDYLEDEDDPISPKTPYSRMGMLLKSMLCISRVLPAYKLSRRQGPDSYVICYRSFSGEPSHNVLGEGHQSCMIGQLETVCGTVGVRVDYRVADAMTIDPSADPISLRRLSATHTVYEVNNYTKQYRHRSDTASSNKVSDEFEQGITSDDSSELRVLASSPPEAPPVMGLRMSDEDLSTEKPKLGAFVSPTLRRKITSSLNDDAQDKMDPFLEFFLVDANKGRNTDEVSDKSTGGKKFSDLSLRDDGDKQASKIRNQGHGGGSTDSVQNQGKCVEEIESESETPDNLEAAADLKLPFAPKSSDTLMGELKLFFDDIPRQDPIIFPVAEDVSSLGRTHETIPGQSITEQLSQYESNLAKYEEMLKTLETSESESDFS